MYKNRSKRERYDFSLDIFNLYSKFYYLFIYSGFILGGKKTERALRLLGSFARRTNY